MWISWVINLLIMFGTAKICYWNLGIFPLINILLVPITRDVFPW